MNKKTLTIAGAAVLALTGLGGVGVAAASDQDTEGPEDAAEFQAFESSQISLTQAIAAAEAETSATAAEAEFEIEDGTAVFEIGLYRADRKSVVGGKRVSVGGDLGGCRIIKKKT